jgi:hypothetical protein
MDLMVSAGGSIKWETRIVDVRHDCAGRSDETSQAENEGFLRAMDIPRTGVACRC